MITLELPDKTAQRVLRVLAESDEYIPLHPDTAGAYSVCDELQRLLALRRLELRSQREEELNG